MQANLQLYQPHLAYLRRAATSFHNILNALKLSGAAMGKRGQAPKEPGTSHQVHEPLSHGKHLKTRILFLHPSSGDDSLRCNIEIRILKRSKNTYDGIQYIWGNPKQIVDIECNDNAVPITINPAAALWQFRHHRRKTRL
jgi:hypothetical protein